MTLLELRLVESLLQVETRLGMIRQAEHSVVQQHQTGEALANTVACVLAAEQTRVLVGEQLREGGPPQKIKLRQGEGVLRDAGHHVRKKVPSGSSNIPILRIAMVQHNLGKMNHFTFLKIVVFVQLAQLSDQHQTGEAPLFLTTAQEDHQKADCVAEVFASRKGGSQYGDKPLQEVHRGLDSALRRTARK